MTEQEIKYQKFVDDDIKNNKGRLVNCCKELSYLLDNPMGTKCITEHYLNDILTYATTFSKFYKTYSDYKDITDFPIVVG